jgi:spore germination protein YaaH
MVDAQNYGFDLESLVRIQTLVSSQLVDAKAPDGIFYRVQDFSTSHSVVVTQFVDEYRIANDIMPRAKTTDELHSLVCSMTTPYITGENHFTTALLSPALRHYLNDACRLLDPYAELFALKFSDVTLRKKDSLSLTMQDIRAVKTLGEIDLDFLIELYDVWNDYKHRQTKGSSCIVVGI